MVLASPVPIQSEKITYVDVPIIDLSQKRSQVSELIVKACEGYGFFKVINHGVSREIIDRMEEEGLNFFAKPALEKERAGAPNPLGYGTKNIGLNGDKGEVEYLLLHTNPPFLSQLSKAISNDPTKFNCIVNDYIEAVRNLACEILELMAEGLWVHDKCVFSNLIRDVDSDSLIRLNHYPSCNDTDTSASTHQTNRIGFGEHSDPQILTLLRSNNVAGLQIYLEDGLWVPVSPDPMAYCINVGDTLQVMTNGRFKSVRHRALANSTTPRISTIFFGAPPLHASISPLPHLVTPHNPCTYRPFTWGEYKEATYSLRLGDTRLDLFKTHAEEDIA